MVRTLLFHASDVHGSEKAFLKFLTAAKVYKANVINLSGDLTGKVIVPLVEQADGSHRAQFLGSEVIAKTREELENLQKNIRFNGQYPYLTNPQQQEELHKAPEKVDEIFSRLTIECMKRWLSIAEERLKNSGVRCFIMPGNDDRLDLDDVFGQSDIINPEGQVVNLDDKHEMVSTGYTNVTPWHAPRDIPEQELELKIGKMVSKVKDMENCVFNFHCPPYDSGLDSAPKLDEQLKPSVSAAGVVMAPAGSTAVRRAIETSQPLLGLHGHIHESAGVCRLGRTLCLNAGSEYTEGILRGALIRLEDRKVASYQLTSG